jgi:glycosyltransferase involved in cell wall biosynthesis
VVLLSHCELGHLLLPFLRAYCPKPIYVDYCHIEEDSWKSGGHARGAVDYAEQLDLAIVTSEHLKQWMIRRGSQPERVEVCYINVDPDRWHPDEALRAEVRREMGIGNTIPVLLYAGRLCEQKQPKVFANVMKSLRQQGLGFLALVAGEGEDWPWLEQFIRQHHLGECIWMLGAVSSTRMQRLMAASDLFFLPSKWEGIALSAYEAMASGLVVVGADVGGQRELVTPECGLLLPKVGQQLEMDGYTAALTRLLTGPTFRAEMGQRARARICQHFHIDIMGERMIGLFEKARCLAATKPRPPVPQGLGLACAIQAVEYTRLDQLADWMWQHQKKGKNAEGRDRSFTEKMTASLWNKLQIHRKRRAPLLPLSHERSKR